MFALTLTLVFTAADPFPELVHVERFPPLEACSGQIHGWILRWGYCRDQLVTDTNRANYWRREMHRADHAIECWHALLVARGGLAEEEGGDDSPETCRAGLARLKALLGEEAWRAGRMPGW